MRRTSTCFDFVQHIKHDVLFYIFDFVDPKALIRASAVSWSWQKFVISNRVSKNLCKLLYPQLGSLFSSEDTRYVAEWEPLKGEYSSYARLARFHSTYATNDIISEAVSASSTDDYPGESIVNTLYPWDQVPWGGCYWSSQGAKNHQEVETLTYKLLANICVVTEIDIKLFLAYFQEGNPIYAAKAFRFRLGHSISPFPTDDRSFQWTYISPDIQMDGDNSLQKFELPKPVLCIGGFIQIELIGRVQQDEDDLYYICVSHVKVIGEPLYPKLDIEIIDPSSGKFLLKYFPENENEPAPISRYSQLDGSDVNSPTNVSALIEFYSILNPPPVDPEE